MVVWGWWCSHYVCPTLATPLTSAWQTPLSLGFPRQEYWTELPFPVPGDLLDPATEPMSPALQVDFFTTEPPGKPSYQHNLVYLRPWSNDLFI